MPLSEALLPDDLDRAEPNELVRRALGGCTDSFTELSRRFRPRLMNLLRQRLGGRWADAEDVAQDTLARAFEQLYRFDPRYRFSTWLYTIALRMAHDHARGQRRYRDLITAAQQVYDPRPGDAVFQQETVSNIWSSARSCLADNQFTALWLRFGEELSIAEIAQVMGKTRVGVRVLLHRARLRLLRKLSAAGDGKPRVTASDGDKSGVHP